MSNIHNWDLIVTNKTSGTAKLKCPVCSHERRNKADKSLYVNFNSGIAKCFHCEGLFFKDSIEKSIVKDNFTIPVQTWKNYTNLSDKVITYFEGRKINQYTLKHFGITEEKYYQPQLQKEVNNIVFNYFEGDVLVNKKYRSGDKKFTQSKNAKSIFYNINSIVGSDECYIVEGECFDKFAKVLTPIGWKCFEELTKNDFIASVDLLKNITFVKPNAIIKKQYNGKLIEYGNKKGNYTSRTTPLHNLVYEKNEKLLKIKAEDVNSTQINIPRNGVFNGVGVNLSDDMLRLYIAISADFTIRKEGEIYGAFKKERKYFRIKNILESLKISHSINIDSRGYYSVLINRKHGLDAFKLFPNEWIGQLSQYQINLILNEIIFWDGNLVNNRSMTEFNSKEIHNIEFVQTLCHLSGMMSTIVKRKNKFGEWYKATILRKKHSTITKKIKSEVDYNDFVYCVSVDSGMILVKQDNNITISGNCDVMALYEVGIKNVVSVPNGANDNDNYWINSEKYLKHIKKFYIATDNDTKGDEVSEKIAQRLGRFRCERIRFEGKDANEDLINDVLLKTINNREKYPVSGTFKVSDCYEDIISLYENGLPEVIYPKHSCFGRLKDVFSVMRGHLITGTGIPSHGKSNFTEWYVMNLVQDYNMKASFFSPEHHPFALHHTNFIEKAVGRNFWKDVDGYARINRYDIAKYHQWAEEKIYLTGTENGEFPTWDWIFEKFKEQLFSYGVDIFVIDAFNKLGFNGTGNRLQQINDVLTKLTMFAQMNNVIIFLIAHPTKMPKEANGLYASPTLYDVSGSSDFRNQTHDGFSIYRFFGDEENEPKTVFENLKTKMKFQGEIGGQVEFSYHIPSGRYYEKNQSPPSFVIWQEEEVKSVIPQGSLENAFGEQKIAEDNDCPF